MTTAGPYSSYRIVLQAVRLLSASIPYGRAMRRRRLGPETRRALGRHDQLKNSGWDACEPSRTCMAILAVASGGPPTTTTLQTK